MNLGARIFGSMRTASGLRVRAAQAPARYSNFTLFLRQDTLLRTIRGSHERERELSYKLLSEARTKREGYDSQATRHTLSDYVAGLCSTITPYDWQLDLAEALTLGLDATTIVGTGSGKTLPWALPFLLEENRDKICLVISPLNELEADHVRLGCTPWRRRISLSRFYTYARFFTTRLRVPAVDVNH